MLLLRSAAVPKFGHVMRSQPPSVTAAVYRPTSFQ
jgi:hypothetical protein